MEPVYYNENYILSRHKKNIHKLLKITPHADGGFNVLMPYCKIKKGYVFKWDKNYSKKIEYISQDDMIQDFSINKNTKLSIHKSGFVQFSGQGILSGIDRYTNKPKGMGVQSSPLSRPIKSGPTFGAVIWGISLYDRYTKVSNTANILLFEEEDIYLRYNSEPLLGQVIDWDSLAIEGFFFGNELLPHVYKINGEYKITLKFLKFEVPGTVFTLKVIFLKNSPGFLGILVSRICTSHEGSDSGYCLSGPTGNIRKVNGDTIGTGINCAYPLPPGLRSPLKRARSNN